MKTPALRLWICPKRLQRVLIEGTIRVDRIRTIKERVDLLRLLAALG